MAEVAEKQLSASQKQRIEIAKSIGISERCLPPITSKKIAIYRSYDVGEEKEGKEGDARMLIDPLVQESRFALITPPSTVIEGTFTFTDPFKTNLYESQVMIKNVLRNRLDPDTDKAGNPTGGSKMVQEIEPVIFDGGFKVVNIETEFALYVFLELHPLNRSGKFKRAGGPYAFYRYDLTLKGRGVQNVEMDLSLDAMIEVRKMDHKGIIQYASSVPNGVIPIQNVQPSDIKRDFQKWAGEHPREFYGLLRNSNSIARLTLALSFDRGVIKYNDADRTFYVEDQDKFFTHEITDTNPIDALKDFLCKKEGAEHLKRLEELVNYWD